MFGFIASKEGLSIDFKKIQSVIDWPIPKNQTDLKGFVGREFLLKVYHIFQD